MKTREEIVEELQRQYAYRLKLRCDRYTRNECRNCESNSRRAFDLGELGHHIHYGCAAGHTYPKGAGGCQFYKRAYNSKEIEEQFLEDLRDPAVCGAKEPKIAALLWVLHDDPPATAAESPESGNGDGLRGLFRRLFG